MKKIILTFLLVGMVFNAQSQSANVYQIESTPNSEGKLAVSDNDKEKAKHLLNSRSSGFTENKGQFLDEKGDVMNDILFVDDKSNTSTYLRKTGVSYVFSNSNEVLKKINKKVEQIEHSPNDFGEKTEYEWEQELLKEELIKIQRVDMDFVGGLFNSRTKKKQLSIIKEGEFEGYQNYYNTQETEGVLNVKKYQKITQKNIYSGVDVVYYKQYQGELKYDIVVQPYADPNQIKIAWTCSRCYRKCLYKGRTGSTSGVSFVRHSNCMLSIFQLVHL